VQLKDAFLREGEMRRQLGNDPVRKVGCFSLKPVLKAPGRGLGRKSGASSYTRKRPSLSLYSAWFQRSRTKHEKVLHSTLCFPLLLAPLSQGQDAGGCYGGAQGGRLTLRH
jgi:hypothetical protein